MKVVLKKEIKNLGKQGDIKEVADGYARNYLFPQNIAEPVTNVALARLAKEREGKAREAEEDLKRVEELITTLEGQSISFLAKASEEGVLYASISAQKIATKLKKKGFEVTKNNILLTEPIKELGDHEVIVQFPHGLESRIVVVVGEEI